MAKANVILLNSILWNLREVTKLAETIKKHCGDVDCTSWRYPLTSCSELEIFKLLQNNRNLDNYTYILELTYDRLLYLFNLMIKYLESADSLKKFRPSKNVYRPKTLSLAAVLHMIWDRIQVQVENGTRTALVEKVETEESEKNLFDKELNVSKSSICTQSEICSISLCSCCEMVQQFVTQLVLEMEKVLEKQDMCSAISMERKLMKEHLIEMTSWSAMSKWLAAILNDFKTLSEKVEHVTTNSRKLRHRVESGERKIKFKTEQYEEEVRKLETRLRDYEAKNSELKEKMEKLIEERNHFCEQLNMKNSELARSIADFENKFDELKKSYENQLKEKKEKKEKRQKEQDRELKKSADIECKKLAEMEIQNKKLEKTISQLKSDLEMLNSRTAQDNTSFTNRLKDLENKIMCLKNENLSLHLALEEKQKTISDYSTKILQAFPEFREVSKFKVSGNPEIDMANQIEANKLRIQLLNSENENLQKTINKIKSLKG